MSGLYHVVKVVPNSPVPLKVFNPYVIICCFVFGSLAAIKRLIKSSIAIKIIIGGSVKLYWKFSFFLLVWVVHIWFGHIGQIKRWKFLKYCAKSFRLTNWWVLWYKLTLLLHSSDFLVHFQQQLFHESVLVFHCTLHKCI